MYIMYIVYIYICVCVCECVYVYESVPMLSLFPYTCVISNQIRVLSKPMFICVKPSLNFGLCSITHTARFS